MAPESLSSRSADLWSTVVADYVLEPLELELLRLCLEALDRVDDARAEIDQHGPFVVDRFGSRKPSPALAAERDARIAYARLWRELALDGPPAADSRPRRPLGGR